MAKATSNTGSYTYTPPPDLLPFHVIVKVPNIKGDGLISHAFVFAPDQGAAINAVIAIWDNPDGHDIASMQFTCKRSTWLGGSVYEI